MGFKRSAGAAGLFLFVYLHALHGIVNSKRHTISEILYPSVSPFREESRICEKHKYVTLWHAGVPGAPLRSGPGYNYPAEMHLKYFTPLEVLDTKSERNWIKVATDNDTEGWIFEDHIGGAEWDIYKPDKILHDLANMPQVPETKKQALEIEKIIGEAVRYRDRRAVRYIQDIIRVNIKTENPARRMFETQGERDHPNSLVICDALDALGVFGNANSFMLLYETVISRYGQTYSNVQGVAGRAILDIAAREKDFDGYAELAARRILEKPLSKNAQSYALQILSKNRKRN